MCIIINYIPMNIRYLLNKNEISQREKDYIEKKINNWQKYLSSVTKSVLQAEVDLKLMANSFWQVELMLKTPRELFRVGKEGKELLEAFDLADASMQKQLRKKKSKLVDARR